VPKWDTPLGNWKSRMSSLSSTLAALTHAAATHPLWMAGVMLAMMWFALLRAGPHQTH